MAVLLLAEHDNATLKSATLNAVTAALQLGEVTVLVAGENCGPVAEQASKIAGITKVLVSDSPALGHALPEAIAPLLVELAANYSHLVAPATTTAKNILPRAAALADVAMISDIIAVDSDDTFQRPVYAGNAIATVQSSDSLKIISVRTTAFEAAATDGAGVEVETLDGGTAQDLSTFVGAELTQSERPELTSARIVISGGRGMQSYWKMSPTSWVRQSVLRAPPSMPVSFPTIIRLARPVRSWPLTCTSPSAYPAPFSIWPE